MRKITALAAFGAVAGAPGAISAGSLDASLSLGATVTAGCTAMTAQAPAFASTALAPGAYPAPVSGSVSVTCASGVPAVITFNAGLNPTASGAVTGTSANPQLVDVALPNATIPYQLWTGSAAPAITGTGISAHVTATTGALAGSSAGISINGASTGAAVVKPIYAALIAAVAPGTPSGTYSDTIGVTLTF